jgi:hypothetical protein
MQDTIMRRSLACACAIATLLLLASDRPGGQGRATADGLPGLGALFQLAGGAARDSNGDGIADVVAARVIVPAAPATEDTQAAVNIAARLGYETMAMTLPVVLTDAEIKDPAAIALPILIGRDNAFVKKIVERGAIDLKALAPGQGLITVVRSPLGGPDGVVVVGGDDAGTLNAAMELAARLPRLWTMSGIAIGGVEDQTVKYLTTHGVTAPRAAVTSVLVDRERRGLATVTLRVPVPAPTAARAIKALQDLDLAHRRGQEPRTLNFANVATSAIEVMADGKLAGRVEVRRSGLNPRTLTPPTDPEEEAAAAERGQGETTAASEQAQPPQTPPPAGAGQAAGGQAGAAAQAGARVGGAGQATGAQAAGQTGAAQAGAVAQAGAATQGAAQASAPSAGRRGDGAGAPTQAGAAGSGAASASAGAAQAGSPAGGTGAGAAPAGPPKTFDLASVYSIDGWLGDSYVDLIPDRTETMLVVSDGPEGIGAAHIAARLGLESTGITLPLVKAEEKVRDASRESNPILVGRKNKFVQQLNKIGKTRLDDLKPGDGEVHVVPRAFGNVTATVVAGGDVAGTEAASMYLARRVPYLWDTARGSVSLQDLTTEATRFFQARDGAAQVAMLLGEMKTVLGDLKGKTIESVEAKLFVDQLDPKLDAFVNGQIKAAVKGADVKVSSQKMTEPVTVFEDKIDIPWEVDEFWTKFRADVLPKVKAGSKVDLELRVSESPEVRRQVADQARAELTKAGATTPRVRVLSAYKQGFTWLTEQVIPDLKGKGVRTVHVKVAEYHPDLTKKYKFYQVPTRWVHELYPADEIFQRELGVVSDQFTMELADGLKDTYDLEALDGAGRVVYRASFSPKAVEREYLDKFPGWAKVDVTTGWLAATVDGKMAADVRIETDPERFWDYYQSKVLSRVYDNVMRLTGNRPTTDKQPFHRDLDVEVWMSEPDYRLGIDEEQVSSLEALHEDIYFVTLDFYTALGRTTTRQRLASPGKILPIIHPNRPGKPGQARVLYAANASSKPKIEISYKEKGVEKPVKVTREIARIETTAPVPLRAVVRSDRVREIEMQIEPRDDREARRAADALDALVELHQADVYRTALSYDHVEQIAVNIVLKDGGTRRVVPATGVAAPSNIRVATAKPSHPLVVWDHVISPDESEEIVRKLAAYPEVKAYKAGESYRERDISVMELTLPTSSELVSLAKMTTLKPTIFLTGRQHANEVSSTSHTLRLAELIATDPTYREILKKVNVIVQPVENPDGAEIAYNLQKLTPNYMLHAGRYSALGSDVGGGTAGEYPLPESLVRGRVWRDWLPDIYLNLHGYPSHEWVQPFAGYVPPGFRTYLLSRGWYTQLSALRDPRYPAYADFGDAIRDAIVREINTSADVRAMNLRHQARYRKWAFGFEPHVSGEEIYRDTMIYYTNPETGEPTGTRRAAIPSAPRPGTRPSMGAWPQVTYLNSGASETPDETAQGDWLALVTKPGLSFVMASIKYLRDGQYGVLHIDEEAGTDGSSRTLLRVRPVMPGKTRVLLTSTDAKSKSVGTGSNQH